jgi:hypothetical protein
MALGGLDDGSFMTVLDMLKNALQQPEKAAGDPSEFAAIREAAYKDLFRGNPTRVLSHEKFGKPQMGGRVDVRLYEVEMGGNIGEFQVAVTSGMSDYAMKLPKGRGVIRREMIQYFREPRPQDLARLHDMAWLPLAQRYVLDYFHTVGPHPVEMPGSIFLPSLVEDHTEFAMKLAGDEVKLLWHVPLMQRELDYSLEHGTNALLGKMEECKLPWIFDAKTRVPMV